MSTRKGKLIRKNMGGFVPEFKLFYNYFPEPTEPNPFVFQSKEDYLKARDKLDILWEARDEWKDKYYQDVNITENDVLRWKQIYAE